MPIQVKSEIMPLRRVLLHRPGAELDQLVPESLGRLLFDDIPYLQIAQMEHDQFANVLRANGVEVVYLEDLTAEVLRQSDALRQSFINEFLRASGRISKRYFLALQELLGSIKDVEELVQTTMCGVRLDALDADYRGPLTTLVKDESQFVLDPIPNLYFTRDPFASIGGGAALNRMYSDTRNRETIYARYILRYHPEYRGQVPLYYTPEDPFPLEGGDIFNLSASVLAVGISQRTAPQSIERLAHRIFDDESSEIRTVLAFTIPKLRAFMHLDTVMTQVDTDKFIVHPEILTSLRAFELTPAGKDRLSVKELDMPLDQLLGTYLGCGPVTLIQCGGSDSIVSQREQWNDGSNTLCVSPGTVIAYDRNHVTNSILENNGIRVLRIPSSELSRGRGGPRCMSMPLMRADTI